MKTVFIVDDSETNLMAAKQALDGNYKSYALISAEGMFKLMERIVPHLILLDIEMPGMSGLETMAKLKANPKTQKIPVILLTAHSDKETILRGLNQEPADYIVKPFEPNLLLARIQQYIL